MSPLLYWRCAWCLLDINWILRLWLSLYYWRTWNWLVTVINLWYTWHLSYEASVEYALIGGIWRGKVLTIINDLEICLCVTANVTS